jgi:hypothetical protein
VLTLSVETRPLVIPTHEPDELGRVLVDERREVGTKA